MKLFWTVTVDNHLYILYRGFIIYKSYLVTPGSDDICLKIKQPSVLFNLPPWGNEYISRRNNGCHNM